MVRNDIGWLAAFSLLFLGYKGLEQHYPGLPIVHAYFEDLIALPIVLKTALLLVQSLFPRHRNLVFSGREIWVITALVSWYFEWWLPERDVRFTRDVLDVFCYAAGALFFQKVMNRAHPKLKVTEA